MFYNQDIDITTALFIALAGFTTVVLILLLISVIIRCISKGIVFADGIVEKRKAKKSGEATEAASAAAPAEGEAPVKRPVTPGFVELTDVDEPTAAVIMAIVSSKTGIAPERLAFSSIKLIGEAKSDEI